MTGLKQQVFALAFTLAQVAVVGWLDFVTSYEVSLTIFYYIPIAYAAWNLGWGWSFGMGTLAALTLTWAEVAAGRQYSHEWILAERAFMRLLVFGFVAFSFNYFKRTIDRERHKVQRLEAMLTYCTCCHKLRDSDDNWRDFDSLARDGGLEGTAKVCPTCAREVYATSGGKGAGG